MACPLGLLRVSPTSPSLPHPLWSFPFLPPAPPGSQPQSPLLIHPPQGGQGILPDTDQNTPRLCSAPRTVRTLQPGVRRPPGPCLLLPATIIGGQAPFTFLPTIFLASGGASLLTHFSVQNPSLFPYFHQSKSQSPNLGPQNLSPSPPVCPHLLAVYLTHSSPATQASLLAPEHARQGFHFRAFSKLFPSSDSRFPHVSSCLSPSPCLPPDLLTFSCFISLPLIPSNILHHFTIIFLSGFRVSPTALTMPVLGSHRLGPNPKSLLLSQLVSPSATFPTS